MSFGRRRRLRITLTIFALSLFLAALAGSAGAAGTLDQQQPVVDLAVGGFAIGGFYEQKLAQTFTAGVSGQLVEVQVPASCDTGSNLLVSIYGASNGLPSATLLASQSVNSAALSGGGVFNAVDFSSPATVTAGSQLTIVLTSTGGCGIFQGPAGDSYSGGNLYFDSRPNPPGWVCNCEFAGASFDLPFKTFVAVPTASDLLATLLRNVTGLGPGTSLPDKVSQAQTYLAGSDVASACSTLAQFVNEANAQAQKKLTAEQAGTLTTAAKQVETALRC